MKVSVVMATFNGAGYIREQLDSVLAQTIKDFELIVCDDCSTDNTLAILQEYAAVDSRIKIYRNERNLGFIQNFERGVLLSSGAYVALCDQDDIWTEDHLEVLLNNIGDKMISAGDSVLIDKNGNPFGWTISQHFGLRHFPKNSFKRALSFIFFSNQVQGASMLMRREFFSVALPVPQGVNYHDTFFSILSCFYGGMAYTFHPVTLHRRHDSNASSSMYVKPSAYSYYVWSVKFDNSWDREAIINAIMSRVSLTARQKRFCLFCKEILKNNSTFKGRLINGIVKLPLFRTIYHKSPLGLAKPMFYIFKNRVRLLLAILSE